MPHFLPRIMVEWQLLLSLVMWLGALMYREALSRLLDSLREWAASNGVQLGPSTAVSMDSSVGRLEHAIQEIFWEVPCSVLYLLNEVGPRGLSY